MIWRRRLSGLGAKACVRGLFVFLVRGRLAELAGRLDGNLNTSLAKYYLR
jgi:hypothetical protein